MSLSLTPVRVATGTDEEGTLVFDETRRLLAVLVRLSDDSAIAPGHWFLEAGFGRLDGPDHPIFPDVDAAQAWILDKGTRELSRTAPPAAACDS
jgi:hypothetical protein